MRTILQYKLLKYVIENGGPNSKEIEHLRKLNDDMRNIREEEELISKKTYKFCIKEIEFHTYLCELAKDNYRLTQKIHKKLSYQIISSLEEILNEDSKFKQSIRSHEDLIDALVEKDLEKLAEIMEEKVDTAYLKL